MHNNIRLVNKKLIDLNYLNSENCLFYSLFVSRIFVTDLVYYLLLKYIFRLFRKRIANNLLKILKGII
jgi:hypothetical protein